MDFQDKLATYANLLVVHGLNVQPGQVVNITAEIAHREFVQLIVKAAYSHGAKFVGVDYIDPILFRTRILATDQAHYLQYVPPYTKAKHDSFIDEKVCILRLCGSEDPDSTADLDATKINTIQSSLRQTLKHYYTEGIGKSKLQWTVAAASTPKWAKKIFPDLDEKSAYIALWDAIFHICRADRPDCLAAWDTHQLILQRRAKKLNALKIKELHFTGPGTDLKVTLSPKAIFKAGRDRTQDGIDFEPNIPTEECFTTPDCRNTQGKVQVTRPVTVNGKLVRDLQIEFKDGKVSHFTASDGYDNFASFIANDPGACRLGEVALVGTDSPIFQSKHLFGEILYDENAACHIALGFAYRFCLDGGPQMSDDELHSIGCNDSIVHLDFMISSEEVNVTAVTYDDKSLAIIKQGLFQPF